MTYDEIDLLTTIDRLYDGPGPPAGWTPMELGGLDQFHAGGSEAVDRMAATLDVGPGDLVLDVGSGLGGPARHLAVSAGCQVVGVDITEAYVELARQLTARCGLEQRVRFEHGGITDVAVDAPFDAALTMHVQMNVADKTAWFGQIAERVVTGGRLAVWEVCRAGDALPTWPMPWSIDGSDSHLATPDGLLAAIRLGGFEVVEWIDESAWVGSWFDSRFAGGPPTIPSLPMLLDDGFTRTLQFAAAVADRTLTIRRGAFVRVA